MKHGPLALTMLALAPRLCRARVNRPLETRDWRRRISGPLSTGPARSLHLTPVFQAQCRQGRANNRDDPGPHRPLRARLRRRLREAARHRGSREHHRRPGAELYHADRCSNHPYSPDNPTGAVGQGQIPRYSETKRAHLMGVVPALRAGLAPDRGNRWNFRDPPRSRGACITWAWPRWDSRARHSFRSTRPSRSILFRTRNHPRGGASPVSPSANLAGAFTPRSACCTVRLASGLTTLGLPRAEIPSHFCSTSVSRGGCFLCALILWLGPSRRCRSGGPVGGALPAPIGRLGVLGDSAHPDLAGATSPPCTPAAAGRRIPKRPPASDFGLDRGRDDRGRTLGPNGAGYLGPAGDLPARDGVRWHARTPRHPSLASNQHQALRGSPRGHGVLRGASALLGGGGAGGALRRLSWPCTAPELPGKAGSHSLGFVVATGYLHALGIASGSCTAGMRDGSSFGCSAVVSPSWDTCSCACVEGGISAPRISGCEPLASRSTSSQSEPHPAATRDLNARANRAASLQDFLDYEQVRLLQGGGPIVSPDGKQV